MLSFPGFGGLRASSLEASLLRDTNLNTLSAALKPKNCLDLLKKSGKSKWWILFELWGFLDSNFD